MQRIYPGIDKTLLIKLLFIKAPDNNILEFILSKKVILVEGDAEYILAEALFKNSTEPSQKI